MPERRAGPSRHPMKRLEYPPHSLLLRHAAVAACALAGLAACLALPQGASAKTRLVRRYRPGQVLIYQTSLKTQVRISSNPEELKALLPPLPHAVSTRQQNTITVRSIDEKGVAAVETRFDRFEFDTEIDPSLPEDIREAATSAEDAFARRLNGQTLTARYDRAGRLLGFDGAEEALKELDAPMQEAAMQTLRVFLEQMGGGALYPDHPLKDGEEWKLSLSAPPSKGFPFKMEGENTLRFVGKVRHGKIKAAVIESRFTNQLTPSEDESLGGASIQSRAQAMGLDISIRGEGEGRLLVALDDGRVLQNQTTIRQTLLALMPKNSGTQIGIKGPLSLQIESETTVHVDQSDKPLP